MKADEIYAVVEFGDDGLRSLGGDLACVIGPFDHLTKAKMAVREAMAARRAPEEVIRFALIQVRDVMEFEPRVVYRERENGKAAAGVVLVVDETGPNGEPIVAVSGPGYDYNTGTYASPVDVEEAAGDAS